MLVLTPSRAPPRSYISDPANLQLLAFGDHKLKYDGEDGQKEELVIGAALLRDCKASHTRRTRRTRRTPHAPHAAPRRTTPHHAAPRRATPHHAAPRRATPQHAAPRRARRSTPRTPQHAAHAAARRARRATPHAPRTPLPTHHTLTLTLTLTLTR